MDFLDYKHGDGTTDTAFDPFAPENGDAKMDTSFDPFAPENGGTSLHLSSKEKGVVALMVTMGIGLAVLTEGIRNKVSTCALASNKDRILLDRCLGGLSVISALLIVLPSTYFIMNRYCQIRCRYSNPTLMITSFFGSVGVLLLVLGGIILDKCKGSSEYTYGVLGMGLVSTLISVYLGVKAHKTK
jgi:hypothetical protein